MRKLIVVAVVASLMSTAASATRWVVVATTDDAVRYVDADALVRDGETATIWLKTEYATTRNKGESLTIEKWLHDCALGRTKLLALTLYKPNGSVIRSGESPRYREEWEAIVPGSVGERIHRRVCGIGDADPKVDELHEGNIGLNVS